MKQFLAYMIVALAALWMAGCSDDSLSPADQPERGIVIRLSTGDLETRTDLTSQANLQHVTEVYAVLYKGTGDTATFVSVEKLDWNPSTGGNGFQKKEFTLPQTATESLLAGDYTLLCVGLDDASKSVYNLKDEENSLNPAIFSTGKKLADAKATLADGKTANDIAHSELFAGWSGFEFKPDSINVVEVMLKRRVAGVLCYLKDIPSTLTKSDGTGTYTVTKVLLRLFSDQCNSIALPRKEKSAGNTGSQADFGEGKIKNSDVLMSYDLSNCKDSDSDGLYEISVAEDESRLPNTILMGAYMLPIEYFSEDNKPTFTLEIWGISDDLSTGIIPSEECVQSFPVYQNGLLSGSDAEKYSIYPNYIYHIGDKPDPDDKTGDYPMSLAGTKITVKPEPWTEMNVNVDFPSVPVNATMELECNGKNYLGGDDVNLECYGSYMYGDGSDFKLKISPSILKSKWKLSVLNGTDALYVLNNGNYEENFSYEATDNDKEQGKEFHLFLNDYVKKEGEGYREISIMLETYGQEQNRTTGVSSQTIKLKQRKAFIVDMGNKEFRAFANSNMGASSWGYINVTYDRINWLSRYDENDGYIDYTYMLENTNHYDAAKSNFPNSAVYKTYKLRKRIDNKQKVDLQPEYAWYLPAINELCNFLTQYGNNVVTGYYWSADASFYYKDACSVYNDNNDINGIERERVNKNKAESYMLHRTCKVE